MAFSACSEFISPDISSKSILLHSPADSLFTSSETISFWWEKDDAIERYHLRITSGPSTNVTLVLDTLMVTNTLSLSFTPDVAYNWEVYGKNEGSETPHISRHFFIDQTTPEKATAAGLDGDTISGGSPDTLRWLSNDYPLSGTSFPVADSLIVYRRNDSATVGAKYFFADSLPKQLAFSSTNPAPFNGSGTYYWRVLTIDRAGNKKMSDYFRFVIQ